MRVVTLTLNPALDVSTDVGTVESERKLRCTAALAEPGGGGINVARVVAELGGDPLAVVALGGTTGDRVSRLLGEMSLPCEIVRTEEETRESFTVSETSTGRQYRFVLPGPSMRLVEWEEARRVTLGAAAGADAVVLSGSLPDGVPNDAYATIAHDVGSSTRVVADTSGPGLVAAIGAPVALVKPSARELEEAAGRALRDEVDYEEAARALLAGGRAGAVVVSLGAAGALVVPRDADAALVRAPAVRVVSTVGAGDSMVGAISLALARGDELVDAVRLGVATGTATVLTPGTQLCHRADVERLLPCVTAGPISRAA